SLVVIPSRTFLTDVQFVQSPANTASGRASSKANHTSPPRSLLNSLNDVNGTMHRFSTLSQRFQCLLLVLRMLVVPLSGSIFNNSSKSTALPLALSLSARLPAASN